jgi:hypothetical protein
MQIHLLLTCWNLITDAMIEKILNKYMLAKLCNILVPGKVEAFYKS